MRVLQLRGGLDFPQESLDADELRELAVHHLDGDLAIVTHVVRQVDVGHPATADLALDGVSVGERSLQAIEEFHRTCRAPSRDIVCPSRVRARSVPRRAAREMRKMAGFR